MAHPYGRHCQPADFGSKDLLLPKLAGLLLDPIITECYVRFITSQIRKATEREDILVSQLFPLPQLAVTKLVNHLPIHLYPVSLVYLSPDQ